MRQFVFTITAGRTGTEWLANLFAANLQCHAVHEYIGFGDIGQKTPDIGIMQSFNVWGNVPRVREFWKTKMSLIPSVDFYVETNHALAKGGLVENLDLLPQDAEISFVLLRRNWLQQAVSYLRRNDFSNYTIPWQWYLDKRYPRRIVDPTPLEPLGTVGFAAWYIIEMDARQSYYQQLLGDRYRFVDADLETISQGEGAQALMRKFGGKGPISLPPKANVGVRDANPADVKLAERIFGELQIDTKALAQRFIASGHQLGEPSVARHAATFNPRGGLNFF